MLERRGDDASDHVLLQQDTLLWTGDSRSIREACSISAWNARLEPPAHRRGEPSRCGCRYVAQRFAEAVTNGEAALARHPHPGIAPIHDAAVRSATVRFKRALERCCSA